MKAEHKTVSEMLFEELCEAHGVPWIKLPRLPKTQQPDYEVRPSGFLVVAEVKQIDPNDDDKAIHKVIDSGGVAMQTRNPDDMARRVRNHIDVSRSQLREYLSHRPNTPTVLVLYDNARNNYTDPYTIQVALHGWEQVVFVQDGDSMSVVERGFGPRNNRSLRHDKNEHLSAVATLHECWEVESHDRFLALQFYHNPFAIVPFKPSWWNHSKVAHFALEEKAAGKFQNWTLIGARQGAR